MTSPRSGVWVQGLGIPWPLHGCPLPTPGQVKHTGGHGGQGFGIPKTLSGATQHVAGIGRWLVPCSCSGRFSCKVLVYGGCGRIPHSFYAQLASGYFFRARGIWQSLVLVLTRMGEFHTPAARREKLGHYFYKPLVFSRCDSSAKCLTLQWIHVLRQSGSFMEVVNKTVSRQPLGAPGSVCCPFPSPLWPRGIAWEWQEAVRRAV